ncbi:beta-ketoacyl synthase chain length factor [Actinobacillus vicugnae]|uniref:beta-ketoacyl synthase chain length factor n=1 Tax=Actinobacillus vicugnae TaxID=2573093 RepID=UPI0012411A76|nr:beta-ketoacyl synthase chain length factor [Actinobacillus vicugnae]
MEVIAKFQLTEQLDDKSLRQRLKEQGVEARRLSRFTQLALLGALQFREYLHAGSAIYLASSFNSPTKFQKMFENLTEQQLPSPLDFMANINNAAVFQIAQTLNIQGESLFLAMQKNELEKLFTLAELDLAPQQTALIGWVFERYQMSQRDESIWWIVKG